MTGRPRRSTKRLVALFFGGLSAGLIALACSVPAREGTGPRVTACSEGCPETDGSTDGPTEAAQLGFDGGSNQAVRNANCGVPSDCNPDPDQSAWSCEGTLVQQLPSGGGLSLPSELPELGSLEPTPTGAKGSKSALSCQVFRKDTETAVECVRSGEAQEGEACRGVFVDDRGMLRSDCAPGLACVRGTDSGESNAGQCRPYCCFGVGCSPGTWCAPRRVFEVSPGPDPLFVPVCAPSDNCTLLDPGACPAGQVCVLVADRTTSCDVPGKGRAGQPCPCAAGHVCARDTNTCRAICRVRMDSDCPEGLCVGGGSVMPPGFGLCVAP
ncbi:MAG: hypothetical protein RMJ98_05360 [Myxococcales bacterium]|nr:hypothetical protein [Polyangiaceae bacterium]MDW8248718.1 hypothetical protein [Myxococcales bacterium]